jgi:AraC family transcriptional regulator
MLGLFSGGSPHGRPLACAVVRAPGPFSISGIPGTTCSALAMGFPNTVSVVEAVPLDPRRLLVGTLAAPALRDPEGSARALHLQLRPSSPVDPPVVLAAPLLLAEQGAGRRESLIPLA